MAAQSVDSTKTNPYLRLYPKFFAKNAENQFVKPDADTLDTHPCGRPGVVLPSEGFTTKSLPHTTDLSPAEHAVVRQGEALKQQVGPGRHALQYIAVGSAALGLTVACAGHPWAGFAVAAVGLLVGFGVHAYVRHRALNKVGPNGVSGADFKKSFEAMLTEKKGVLNDPALETSRKMYDFLTRNPWEDAKHDLFQPIARAAAGSLRLVKAGLGKVFSSKPTTASQGPEASPLPAV